jgi:hypothetical protein
MRGVERPLHLFDFTSLFPPLITPLTDRFPCPILDKKGNKEQTPELKLEDLHAEVQ